MALLKSKVKKLIEQNNAAGLDDLLSANPGLANEGITIPFDRFCRAKAHPLHRICDAVFAGKITDEEAVVLAKIFVQHGAEIDGDKSNNEGTPLLAAASLHAEQVGIYYVDNGADIHYTYKDDGASALHWAAFCGLDRLVERLIEASAEIDQPDRQYHSTPLGWAIHSLQTNDETNKLKMLNCILLLLKQGADKTKLDEKKIDYLLHMVEDDPELQKLL